jgi:hypothetical protein
MARARNIKPGFFQNDELAELTPITRLYFIGLWTICDFKGSLEYRPKKIKAQILPYDNVSIEELTINLERSRFIRLYSSQGKSYINITKFTKHQNPHKNEKAAGSSIPEFEESEQQVLDLEGELEKPDLIGTSTDNIGTAPADSLIPLTDSLNLIPDTSKKTSPTSKHKYNDDQYQLAVELSNPVKQRFPTQNINLKDWAEDIRKLMEIDRYSRDDIYYLWRWRTDHQGNNNFSWANNCRTPGKLRQKKDGLAYFEIMKNQMLGECNNENNQGFTTGGRPSLIDRVKNNANNRRKEREAEDERTSGNAMAEDGGSVREHVHQPVRGGSGGDMGNIIDGDYRKADG